MLTEGRPVAQPSGTQLLAPTSEKEIGLLHDLSAGGAPRIPL